MKRDFLVISAGMLAVYVVVSSFWGSPDKSPSRAYSPSDRYRPRVKARLRAEPLHADRTLVAGAHDQADGDARDHALQAGASG
jgi:hypothetical protein